MARPGSLCRTPPDLGAQLEAALAKGIPTTTPKFRKEIATAFVQSAANRALAVAPQAGRLRYTTSWPTRDLAEEKILEKCQQIYDEPCALIAVNDTVLSPGAGGTWPVRDAPRVRYAGPFNLERIPGMRAEDLQRELESLFERENMSPTPGTTMIPATFLRVTVRV